MEESMRQELLPDRKERVTRRVVREAKDALGGGELPGRPGVEVLEQFKYGCCR
jgi:hypothetical protein